MYAKRITRVTRQKNTNSTTRLLEALGAESSKHSKYHNNKTYVNGIPFDSKKEARYYEQLLWLQKAGEVKTIERQVAFVLQESYKRNGQTIRAIKYLADFVVEYADGHKEVIDVKGVKTDVYKLKKKILLFRYPEIDFKEE